MSNFIDINDILTYPKELLCLFDINDFISDKDSNEILGNYDFKCCHVFCTNEIDNYNEFGILRPFIVSKNNKGKINITLKNIILKPIYDRDDYDYYAFQYDKILFEEYYSNKDIVKDWYGKYSCICYTMDDLSKINISNPCYEPAINCYGGELFRNLGFSDKEAENIAKKFKSYVISFRLSYDEIKKRIPIDNLVEHMKLMYIDGKSSYGFEGSINKDIPSIDFIEVKEIN